MLRLTQLLAVLVVDVDLVAVVAVQVATEVVASMAGSVQAPRVVMRRGLD